MGWSAKLIFVLHVLPLIHHHFPIDSAYTRITFPPTTSTPIFLFGLPIPPSSLHPDKSRHFPFFPHTSILPYVHTPKLPLLPYSFLTLSSLVTVHTIPLNVHISATSIFYFIHLDRRPTTVIVMSLLLLTKFEANSLFLIQNCGTLNPFKAEFGGMVRVPGFGEPTQF